MRSARHAQRFLSLHHASCSALGHTYCTPFRPLVATCDAQIAMQLMRVVGQGSVNNFLKLRATMLLKQPKMLEQLIPVFGLAKVSAAPPGPIAQRRPILRD